MLDERIGDMSWYSDKDGRDTGWVRFIKTTYVFHFGDSNPDSV